MNEEDQYKMKLKEKPNTPKKIVPTNQTSTSNRYTTLLEEENEDHEHKACPENTPKPPPIYLTDVKNISPLILLLEKIIKQQYNIKAHTHNQVKVQPKTF
jgi:hypothetical protein